MRCWIFVIKPHLFNYFVKLFLNLLYSSLDVVYLNSSLVLVCNNCMQYTLYVFELEVYTIINDSVEFQHLWMYHCMKWTRSTFHLIYLSCFLPFLLLHSNIRFLGMVKFVIQINGTTSSMRYTTNLTKAIGLLE